MRNLYSKLGINVSASRAEIERAISSCPNASVREHAKEILLVEHRRIEYDRLNSLLMFIGQLRAGLGISHAENWDEKIADQYTRFHPLGSQRRRFYEKVNMLNNQIRQQHAKAREYANSQEQPEHGCLGNIIVIGVIVAVMFIYNENKKNDYTAPVTSWTSENGASTREADVDIYQGSSQRALDEGAAVRIPPKPIFNHPPQATPPNGEVYWYVRGAAEAPFEIRTEGSSDYYVKLKDANSKRDILGIFIRGGERVEIEVPLGNYSLTYASGNVWYGLEHYFGPDGSYNKANTVLSFDKIPINNGYQFRGHTIQLYRVRGGNLSTSTIPADAF